MPKTSEEKYKNQSYSSDVVTSASLVDAEINWQLPLLRNVDGILDQRTYDLAVLELQDEQWVFREFQEKTVGSYLKGYFEYAILSDDASLLKVYINQLDLFDAYIKRSAFDEKLVSYNERALNKAKSRLVSLKGEQMTLAEELENILDPGELANIKAVKDYVKTSPFGDVESSAIELKRIRIERLKNQRQIHYYQNALKPELDLSINARRAVQKGNYSSYSESDSTDVEVSLSFEYPLSGDVGAKTLLRKYQLKARQLEIKYNKKLESLKAKQKTLLLRLQASLNEIDFIINQLAQQDLTEIGFKGLMAVEVRPYVDGLADTLELRLNYNDELIKYQHARIDYDNLMSRLLAKPF